MSKTYGQIAYEVGGAHLLNSTPDVPVEGFADWSDLSDYEHAYWDELARAVSKATYDHHFPTLPIPDSVAGELRRDLKELRAAVLRYAKALLAAEEDPSHESLSERSAALLDMLNKASLQ
jgi:hypothetical protein